jgi:hypothetical protein
MGHKSPFLEPRFAALITIVHEPGRFVKPPSAYPPLGGCWLSLGACAGANAGSRDAAYPAQLLVKKNIPQAICADFFLCVDFE